MGWVNDALNKGEKILKSGMGGNNPENAESYEAAGTAARDEVISNESAAAQEEQDRLDNSIRENKRRNKEQEKYYKDNKYY